MISPGKDGTLTSVDVEGEVHQISSLTSFSTEDTQSEGSLSGEVCDRLEDLDSTKGGLDAQKAQILAHQIECLEKLQVMAKTRPIKVQHFQWDTWHDFRHCRTEGHDALIYTRGILLNEVVFDFDHIRWDDVRDKARTLVTYLDGIHAPHLNAYSGGKGVHINLFLSHRLDFLDDAFLNELKDQDVDVQRVLRETIFDAIVREAGLPVARFKGGQKVEGLDRGKVSWSKSGDGSQIRMVGTPRDDGRFKTTILEIPDHKPEPGPMPVFPSERPQPWDYAAYRPLVEKALRDTLVKYKASSTRSVSYAGGLRELPCCKRLLDGSKEGSRDCGALTLAMFCHKTGLDQEEAKRVMAEYNSKCENMTPDHERAFLAKIGYVYGNGRMPSCEWVRSNLGLCQRASCPLEAQRKDAAVNKGPKEGGRVHLAESILSAAERHGVRVFKNASKRAYASYRINGHAEIWPVESANFAEWLRWICYKDEKMILPSEALNAALATLKTMARFDGEQVTLDLRVAKHDGSFWYDLGRDDWRVVRIHPDIAPHGWEIIEAPTHMFWRSDDLLPMPEPVPAANADAFWGMINLPQDPGERLVFKCQVVSFLIPGIAHALLSLFGKMGCAKTDAAKIIKLAIDPSDMDKLKLADDRNVNNTLEEHYLAFLDNVSKIKRDTADILCRGIDGDSSSDRKLCTNREQERYKFQRCVMIASVEDVISEFTDLAQRSNQFELPYIEEMARIEATDLYERVEPLRATTLGFFLTIVSKAMAEHERMKAEQRGRLPRMADFSTWCESISRSMGFPKGEFTKSYFAKIGMGVEASINANALAQAILVLLNGTEADGGYAASADKTFRDLTDMAGRYSIPIKGEDWPKSPNSLGGKMANIVENLRGSGIIFEKKKANELNEVEKKLMLDSSQQIVSVGRRAGFGEVQRGQTVYLFKWKRSEEKPPTPISEDPVTMPVSVVTMSQAREEHRNTDASVPERGSCYDAAPPLPHPVGEAEEGFEKLLGEISRCNRRASHFESLDPKNKERIVLLLKRGSVTESADGYLSLR